MKTLALMVFCAGLALAQTGSSTTCTADTSTSFCSSSNLVWSNGTGLTIRANGGGTWQGINKNDPRMKPFLTIKQVSMSARRLEADQLAPASYLNLAASIGLDNAAVDEARMLTTIAELQLKVYPFAKVDAFLYQQAVAMSANYSWVWKPLRVKDWTRLHGTSARGSDGMGWVSVTSQYDRRIPERVIGTIAKILQREPGALLLVSDFEALKPDPFLAITTPKLLEAGKIWIVEQWDEPAWKDGPAQVVVVR